MARLNLTCSTIDVPVPVSFRNLRFCVAKIYNYVQNNEDLHRKMSQLSIYQLYRVMNLIFENKLFENSETINSMFRSDYYLYTLNQRDIFTLAKPINVVLPGVAVMIKLCNVVTVYDSKHVAMRPKNVMVKRDFVPAPELVFYTNLKETVCHLSENRTPNFKARTALPGAEWDANGTLQNPHDFWPEAYDNDEKSEVKEWLTLSTLRSHYTAKLSENGGGQC